MWGVNRWLSARFNLLSSAVVGITGFVAVLTPSISASTAGFALAFASTITGDVSFLHQLMHIYLSDNRSAAIPGAALRWFGTVHGKKVL